MKSPSAMLVIDSNIVISGMMSKRQTRVLQELCEYRALLLTAMARSELVHLQKKLLPGMQGAERLAELLKLMTIIPDDVYDHHMSLAAITLAQAVASKNGSMRDAHILACAWEYRADIWSHDRDFAGCGWSSWSTANLRDAVLEERT